MHQPSLSNKKKHAQRPVEGQALYWLCLALIAALFIFALFTRLSLRPADALAEAVPAYTLNVSPAGADQIQASAAPRTGRHDQAQPDAVILARCSGIKRYVYGGRETEVTVEKVYHGRPEMVGRSILVAERLNIFPKQKRVDTDGYLPMRQGEQYILLLEPQYFPPEKKLSPDERRSWFLWRLGSGQSLMSKFIPHKNAVHTLPADRSFEVRWDRCPDYEMIAAGSQAEAAFYNWKQEVFARYKIN